MFPNVAQFAAQWAQVATTLFLGIAGFVIAGNYRRQVKVKLSEKLSDSYMDLWSLMEVTHINRNEPTLMTRDDMSNLAIEMKRWYFRNGNGLLISNSCRVIFFVVYHNLRATRDRVQPSRLNAQLMRLSADDAERMQACACSRQASRLRAQMKTDLGAYRGMRHLRGVTRDERELFASAGIKIGFPSWTGAEEENCFCGFCERGLTVVNILRRRLTRPSV